MNSKKSIKSLIIAHLDGNLQGTDLEKFTKWLSASKENAKYYAQIKDIWQASVHDASVLADTEKEWTRFMDAVQKESKTRPAKRLTALQIISGVAAILIIGIITGILVSKYVQNDEPGFITVSAPKGSVSYLVLDDSTEVYLNAGTSIRYSPKSNKKKREVFLEGEAWFDVAKRENKSFVVHTAFYDVKVMGTQFNIKSYPTDKFVETTLEEGKIQLSSSENFKLGESVILKPGEQVRLNRESGKMVIKNVDTRLFTSWKENKLIFLNLNFSELVVLLERKYGIDIEVNDPEILKYHYTGTIKNESVLEIMELIKHTLPIQYKIEGQIIKVTKL